MKNERESRMRPKSSTPRTDFGVRLIMARSRHTLSARRGSSQLLAEFVVLTLWIADLPAQHGALVTRFQILSIERLGERVHSIREMLYHRFEVRFWSHRFLLRQPFAVRSAA